MTGAMHPLPIDPPVDLGYKPANVEIIRKALVGVTQEGTSTRVFAGAGYLSGGKTGTAQAVTIGQKDKYNGAKLEEHQRDHAVYMAFAPADKPEIALAVIVENAGWGAGVAAPIARRVFDYVLMGQYPSPEDMAAVQKGLAAAPTGTPRRVADMNALLAAGGATQATAAPTAAASSAKAAKPASAVKGASPPLLPKQPLPPSGANTD
jgi:penicillin-binding protein 2